MPADCCATPTHRPPSTEPMRRCPFCHGRGWLDGDAPMRANCGHEADAVLLYEAEGLALCGRCARVRLDAERDAERRA